MGEIVVLPDIRLERRAPSDGLRRPPASNWYLKILYPQAPIIVPLISPRSHGLRYRRGEFGPSS